MILETDPKNQYNRQLTARINLARKVKSLEFALKHFRDDPSVHCIVKKNEKTEFKEEVFIKGKR